MNYKECESTFLYQIDNFQDEKRKEINSLIEEEDIDENQKNDYQTYDDDNIDNFHSNEQNDEKEESIVNKLNEMFDYYDLNQPKDTTQILNMAINLVRREPKAIEKFMDASNIPLLVELCERMNARPNVYLFLKILAEQSPEYIKHISHSNIYKYLKQNLTKHSKRRTKYLALDLILTLTEYPQDSVITLWKKGIFDLFYDDINEINEFSEIELLILLNASKTPDIPYLFSDYWINALIPLSEETENTYATNLIIQIFIELSSNNVQFDQYIIDNEYMEYLSSFIHSDNVYLQISVLRFLGILCSFGDEIIHQMLLYNVLTEVRNIFTDIKNKKEFSAYFIIECAALTFLRSWCEFSNECLNSLFSFLSQINIYEIFTESSYTVKAEMVKFIVILSSKANATVLYSILTEDLALNIIDCLESCDEEYKNNTQQMLQNTIHLFTAPYPQVSEYLQNLYDENYFEIE